MDTKFATKLFSKFTSNGLDTIQAIQSNTKLFEDLPDGSCFSRILNVLPEEEMNCESVIKKCEYVGSFPVTGNDQNSRAEFVKSQLRQMQHTTRKKRVLLVISLTGIKVCSVDGKSVLMAHALRRISFSTCDPENRQFSFLAREPNGHFSLQYCHSFLAADSKAIKAEYYQFLFINQLLPMKQHLNSSMISSSRRRLRICIVCSENFSYCTNSEVLFLCSLLSISLLLE